MNTTTLDRQASLRDIIDHPELGRVYVTVKPVARRLIARWKNDSVHLTAPAGLRADQLIDSLDRMAPRLLPRRPALLLYSDGSLLDFDGLDVAIGRQSLNPGRLIIGGQYPHFHISVGSDLVMSDRSTTAIISRALTAIARKSAATILIPRARQLADEVGHHPAGWYISSGRHILGQCNSSGVINLSFMNVFLPVELRDYIVYHELAHLSEMNHSPRFHEICDRYCHGHEKELITRLKTYNWPVMR